MVWLWLRNLNRPSITISTDTTTYITLWAKAAMQRFNVFYSGSPHPRPQTHPQALLLPIIADTYWSYSVYEDFAINKQVVFFSPDKSACDLLSNPTHRPDFSRQLSSLPSHLPVLFFLQMGLYSFTSLIDAGVNSFSATQCLLIHHSTKW